MSQGWDDVIMHLVKAQQIAKELPRSEWWRTYVDEIDCDSALAELIEAAKSELRPVVTLPSGHTSTCTCPEELKYPELAHVHPFTD